MYGTWQTSKFKVEWISKISWYNNEKQINIGERINCEANFKNIQILISEFFYVIIQYRALITKTPEIRLSWMINNKEPTYMN